jgi:hypothetical protein
MDGPGGWVRNVNSVAYLRGEELVLVDPLVENWAMLDGLAEGRDVVVILAASWHRRSTDAVLARYRGELRDVTSGVEALPIGDEGERLLWLPDPRALVSAEALTGSAEGLRVAESPLLRNRAEFAKQLRSAAALPVRMVLPAHGPPVLEDGAAAILAALDRPAW